MSSNKTISGIFQSLTSAIKIQPKRPPLVETDWFHLQTVSESPSSKPLTPQSSLEDARSDDETTADLLAEIAESLCENFEASIDEYDIYGGQH